MNKFFIFSCLLFMVGCDPKQALPTKEYKKISMAQRVCLENSRANIGKEFVLATKDAMNAYRGKDGYIPLLIEQRRRMEKLCYIHASCYGDSEPNTSLEFEECLDGWANQQQD